MMLEIIVETVEDAIAAVKGGANQIVIHSAFTENGLTPSAGMVQRISSLLDTKVLVMLRPHARGFILSNHDIEVMRKDIELDSKNGADGFVLGAINKDGKIDHKAINLFKDAAGDLTLHFHLAWELTNNIEKALEDLIELGISSIRTNGGFGPGGKAIDRVERLYQIQKQANNRINIFLAGGVNSQNIENLVMKTGILHAHAGSSVRKPQNPSGIVIEEKVRELRNRLERSINKYKSQ